MSGSVSKVARDVGETDDDQQATGRPPLHIPLPTPTAVSMTGEPALMSPGAQSTTSNESSRGPDLSSATPRMYPIRSVLYPSSGSRGDSNISTVRGGSGAGTEKSDSRSAPSNRRMSSAGPGVAPPLTPMSEHPPSPHQSVNKPSVPAPGSYTSLDPYLSSPTGHRREEAAQEEAARIAAADGAEIEGDDTTTEVEIGGSTTGSLEVLMTRRFEHSRTEDGGEWVITGRDGKLERCEDEPIHAPGAVQAFGVLICVDEDEEHNLVVKQVSENSRFILGLPPSLLLRSQCLTLFLSEDEGEALRDALSALDDRDTDPDNTDLSPLSLQLSGTGLPGTGLGPGELSSSRFEWTCHCAIHRPNRAEQPNRAVIEFELVDDRLNPLTTIEQDPIPPDERVDSLQNGVDPTEADLLASTVSIIKPLRALTRRKRRETASSRRREPDWDMVALLSQINEQLNMSEDLEEFLKITAGVFKELTEADRTMIYQFDEAWNGRVVAEQVEWARTRDLFRGLNFPATDIPPQARELYKINKVRILYDRDQPTARMCCRSLEEVETPLNMTHCHLRAMSPIHIKYLSNMGVRSSMSISITAFGNLWGLIAIHTYGKSGHRVSFPVRQLCKLLGDGVSRNIERLSYAKRLKARKLINTAPSTLNPSGYIVAKVEDLLTLFDADFGVLSIADEAKILGEVGNSQELLAMVEYLRQACFTEMKSSQDIRLDFPGINYEGGFEMIAGLLCVPLSSEGKDFIVFFRRGQLQEVHWAGNPYANKKPTDDGEAAQPLEPRKSFKTWSETVVGKCRAWSDEQLETAGVLCLVYGKFIAVWRQKESAVAANKLTTILLANASHEVRTPLNAIINYLELALDGPVEGEVRENLTRSHAASRSLIHVINDLLDLTRAEQGNDLFLQDPFDLHSTINEATAIHKAEAGRRGLALDVVETPAGTPPTVLGDRGKVRLILTNVVANAVKHTETGSILIEWGELVDANLEDALEKKQDSIRLGISITDTGVGISDANLEKIFREFEQVSTVDEAEGTETTVASVGLGLAVVARIVRNLGGQLRVESKVGEGSKFTFILPFRLPASDDSGAASGNGSGSGSSRTISAMGSGGTHISAAAVRSSSSASGSQRSDIDSLINAMSSSHMDPTHQRMGGGGPGSASSRGSLGTNRSRRSIQSNRSKRSGEVAIEDSNVPLRAVRLQPPMDDASPSATQSQQRRVSIGSQAHLIGQASGPSPTVSPLGSPVASPSTVSRARAGSLRRSPPVSTSEGARESPTHISEYKSDRGTSSSHDTLMRVLVVEDEMVNRLILQKRLKKEGHEVVIAEHGGDALRLLEHDSNYDIILMDLQMPICDGYEASLGIRKRETLSPIPQTSRRPSTILNGRIPIIAVSASLPERQKGQLVSAGIDGWILKPVDTKRLQSLMRGALDLSERKRDVYKVGSWELGGWLDAGPPLQEKKD